MTAEQFAYWLQGFAELTEGTQPTPEQWKSINDHLNTVFVKVTPQLGSPLNPRPGTITPQIFADPARQLTPLEMLERVSWPFPFGRPVITC